MSVKLLDTKLLYINERNKELNAIFLFKYNFSGDHRDGHALIGRGLRHILL